MVKCKLIHSIEIYVTLDIEMNHYLMFFIFLKYMILNKTQSNFFFKHNLRLLNKANIKLVEFN